MEILGDGEPGRRPVDPRPERDRDGRPVVDLDLGLTDDDADDVLVRDDGHARRIDPAEREAPEELATKLGADGPPPSRDGRPGDVVAVVTSPEALAVTGLLVHVSAIMGFPSVTVWSTIVLGPDSGSARPLASAIVTVIAVLAAVGTALGGAAVLRLGPRASRLATGLAGAAVLLGFLLLLAAGAMLWYLSGLPPESGPGPTG